MAIPSERLIKQYHEWLRNKTYGTEVNGSFEIATPFLDRNNDRFQIYVQHTDGGYRLSDDGYIIGDLESSGCLLDTPGRKKILDAILLGFGVRNESDELIVDATEQDFPRKKHALLQAMLTVNDMFLTAKQRVESLFVEDVQKFLEDSGVRYIQAAEFTGKSGYTHKFDFVIPKSGKMPERLIRAINASTRDSATSLLFAWTDTKEVRPAEAQAYAILNDRERNLSGDLLSAFQHYDEKAVLWSQRDQYAKEFAA